jgi:hypothetical protein
MFVLPLRHTPAFSAAIERAEAWGWLSYAGSPYAIAEGLSFPVSWRPVALLDALAQVAA